MTVPAMADAAKVRAVHSHDPTLVPVFRRLAMALSAVRVVVNGRACWTAVGAEYFGIEWERPKRRSRRKSHPDAVEIVQEGA